MLGAAEEYKIALATIFVHFQHGGHEPEVVMSHHPRHLTFADGVYPNCV